MKACLMVMNARDIPSCRRAFEALDIDQCWFRGFREEELGPEIWDFVFSTDYDAYILASDDLLPKQKALDAVLDGLTRHDAFTGWCNLAPDDPRANVRTSDVPFRSSYFWLQRHVPWLARRLKGMKDATFESVAVLPETGDFRVYQTGYAFTGMSRRLWLGYPLARVAASDFVLFRDLKRGGVEVWSTRKAYFYHLASKEGWNVGKVRREVRHVKRDTEGEKLEWVSQVYGHEDVPQEYQRREHGEGEHPVFPDASADGPEPCDSDSYHTKPEDVIHEVNDDGRRGCAGESEDRAEQVIKPSTEERHEWSWLEELDDH